MNETADHASPRVTRDDLDNDLDALGDRIAVLAAHIHAATYELLRLVGEFDRLSGWQSGGHRSCAHWLAFRTGVDLGAAREKVRTARALADLPATSAAMARGELSFSKVRALTRVATPESEGDLLELARGCTVAQLERIVRAWKRHSRADEADLERDRHERRALAVFPDDDGMYVVKGCLDAETGALLMRALEAASDALFREAPRPEPESDEARRRAAAQRRADAIGLLAERALAGNFGAGDPRAARDGGDGRRHGPLARVPLSGMRAERYQVVLHVDHGTLAEDGDTGRSDLEDGTRVSAETSRRLCCDAAVVRVEHAEDGSVLDVGRRMRTVPPALRRALEVRDRGCRFPGCGLRFTDAHHVRHWADGGETSLANCLLLCRFHHRLVHEEGWSIEWWGAGRPAFKDPLGQAHFEGRWQPPLFDAAPVEALEARNGARGIEPDWRTASARWKRDEDIPDEVYFSALEAIA